MGEDAAATTEATRCAFIALIGAPNAGKSTLINALVGSKVAIVTPKVQTTRALLRGIAMEGSAQLVLIDTPGIFAPRRRLDRAMVTTAWGGAHDADIVALLIDAKKGITMFKKTQVPILGVIENMSVFTCPDCGSSHAIFGHGGARETAEKLGAPFLGEIPLVPLIRETSDAGTPVSVSVPDGPEARAFLDLATKVAAALESESKSAPKIIIESA